MVFRVRKYRAHHLSYVQLRLPEHQSGCFPPCRLTRTPSYQPSRSGNLLVPHYFSIAPFLSLRNPSRILLSFFFFHILPREILVSSNCGRSRLWCNNERDPIILLILLQRSTALVHARAGSPLCSCTPLCIILFPFPLSPSFAK